MAKDVDHWLRDGLDTPDLNFPEHSSDLTPEDIRLRTAIANLSDEPSAEELRDGLRGPKK